MHRAPGESFRARAALLSLLMAASLMGCEEAVSTAGSAGTPPATPAGYEEAGAADLPVPGLKLRFRSSFEEGVRLANDADGQTARLTGTDQGFAWDGLEHMFNYVAEGAVQKNLVESRLTDERAHSGSRSLYMGLNVVDGASQNRLQFESTDEAFGGEIFTRRWLYLPDLAGILTEELDDMSIGGTREFALEGEHDFSLPLYIFRQGGHFVWRIAGVDYARGPYWSTWTRAPFGFVLDSGRVPVPKERWFRLDIYVKRDTRDGQVKVWVDDRLVFDVKGIRTKREGSTWFTKLADFDGTKPGHLWVDDVEIYGR